MAYFEVWDALVGLPGVKHAKGHLRHQADIVMALKSETQLLQAVCHNLWSGPATNNLAAAAAQQAGVERLSTSSEVSESSNGMATLHVGDCACSSIQQAGRLWEKAP